VLLAPIFLFFILSALFVLLRVVPGDPISASLGGRLSAEEIDSRREVLGLNESIGEQYFDYLSGVVTGDFGQTFNDPRPVTGIIADRFPATFELTLFAMFIAVIIGVVVGAFSARFRDGPLDVAGRLFGVAIYAAPVFWTGILAQLFFANYLGWFPSSRRLPATIDVGNLDITGFYLVDSLMRLDFSTFMTVLHHLAMPGITLGLLISGIFIRLVRVNMLQTLRADYVEAAHARGVPDRQVLFRHAFRNALIPVITIVGLQFALLLGGAILTEITFSWPGLGSVLVESLTNRDFAAVQGIVTFFAVIVVGLSLIIDIVNGLVDPRVRY
jgi:peptide/nickel transport system permease protein